MANSGYEHEAEGCSQLFTENFAGFDYVVCPSGSCTLHIKHHLHTEKNAPEEAHIRKTVYELCEFMVDVLKVTDIKASFPHKVGMHQSCHGQRGLHLSSMTELVAPEFSKPEKLLSMVKGLQVTRPERKDECCGFGGTFCVFEEAVSVKMGKDRIVEHAANEVEYITGVDTSCLMHLEGILNRNGSKIKTIHIAEILNSNL